MKLNLIVIILLGVIPQLASQTNVDTIGTNFSSKYKNGVLGYIISDELGNEIQFINGPKIDKLTALRYKYLHSNSFSLIKNDSAYIYNQGKIYSIDEELKCDIEFQRIYGNVEGNYLVLKNGSISLLKNDCSLQYVKTNKQNYVVGILQSNAFYILDKSIQNLSIYAHTGIKLFELKNIHDVYYKDKNEYLFGVKTNKIIENGDPPWIYAFYNLKGQKVGIGELSNENRCFSIILNYKEEKEYYYKAQKIVLPDKFKDITVLTSRMLKVELKNGNYGVLSNSLLDTVIEPKFKQFTPIDFNAIGGVQWVLNDNLDNKDIIYTLDNDSIVHIFDYIGNEINLNIKINSLPNIINPIGLFKLNEDFMFYTIHESYEVFHIFDQNWNYIAKETKYKNPKYNLKSKISAFWNLIPIKTLKHFSNKLKKDEFFRVVGNTAYVNNIIDCNQNFVFKQNIYLVKKLNKNTFALTDAKSKKVVIVKLKLAE